MVQPMENEDNIIKNIINQTTDDTKTSFIMEDQGLSEEESQEAWDNYQTNGYHYPSMTRVVENNMALTEMSLKKKTPMTPVEFLESFQIYHLPYDVQNEPSESSTNIKGPSANTRLTLENQEAWS